MNTTLDTPTVTHTIRQQITAGVLFSLGAHNFHAIHTPAGAPALKFTARILPFNKNGQRGEAPRNMNVVVALNARDLYDITVTYDKTSRSLHTYGQVTTTTHYQAENIDADALSRLMLSLDYDGPEVLNPRTM